MNRPVILWGATGHARVLKEFLTPLGLELVALFDNNPAVTSPWPGIPLFHGRSGFAEWRQTARSPEAACLVAIGGNLGQDRLEIQQFLESEGLPPVPAVHPTAFVAASARLGKGCHVLARAAVCVDVALGDAAIINTSASVDHECVLGRGVHVAPGATLAGRVRVGDFSLIGVGAVVLPRITIGANTVVGAGAVVTRDVPDNCVAFGNPARIIRGNPALPV